MGYSGIAGASSKIKAHQITPTDRSTHRTSAPCSRTSAPLACTGAELRLLSWKGRFSARFDILSPRFLLQKSKFGTRSIFSSFIIIPIKGLSPIRVSSVPFMRNRRSPAPSRSWLRRVQSSPAAIVAPFPGGGCRDVPAMGQKTWPLFLERLTEPYFWPKIARGRVAR